MAHGQRRLTRVQRSAAMTRLRATIWFGGQSGGDPPHGTTAERIGVAIMTCDSGAELLARRSEVV